MDINVRNSSRLIHAIAHDILAAWTKPNYAAKPYLDAMLCLDSVNDTYGADSARDIVLRFLCNATSWRGEDARRLKAELKAALAGKTTAVKL